MTSREEEHATDIGECSHEEKESKEGAHEDGGKEEMIKNKFLPAFHSNPDTDVPEEMGLDLIISSLLSRLPLSFFGRYCTVRYYLIPKMGHTSLYEEIERVQSQYNESSERLSSLRRELGKLESKCRQTDKSIVEFEDDIEEYGRTYVPLQAHYSVATTELNSLQSFLLELENQNEDLKSEIERCSERRRRGL